MNRAQRERLARVCGLPQIGPVLGAFAIVDLIGALIGDHTAVGEHRDEAFRHPGLSPHFLVGELEEWQGDGSASQATKKCTTSPVAQLFHIILRR